MPSPEAIEIETGYRQQRLEVEGQPFDLQREREKARDSHEETGLPKGVQYETGELAGVPVVRAMPDRNHGRFNVVYLHGGAFCLMSAHTHHRVAGHVANACGAEVIIPDYGLAPEHPFPHALNETVSVVKAAQKEQGTGLTALMGDSAGGGLTLSALLNMRDAGLALPFAAVLMAPWLDLTLSSPSVRTAAEEDVVLTERSLRIMARHYAGSAELTDPRVSPLFGRFHDMPPLYLQAAGKDLLRDDCMRLRDAYADQGLELKHEIFPDVVHSFHFFVGRMPEADDAHRKIGEFLIGAERNLRDRPEAD